MQEQGKLYLLGIHSVGAVHSNPLSGLHFGEAPYLATHSNGLGTFILDKDSQAV